MIISIDTQWPFNYNEDSSNKDKNTGTPLALQALDALLENKDPTANSKVPEGRGPERVNQRTVGRKA